MEPRSARRNGVATSHVEQFLADAGEILARVDRDSIEAVVAELVALRDRGGRLFFVGSGGGAGHASHAVCDFRKLGGFEAYAASDNVSELTARVNDDGWDTSYAAWLRGSRLNGDDVLFVFSVGGGDRERGVSVNLVHCLDLAKSVGARICGIVGRDGGYTRQTCRCMHHRSLNFASDRHRSDRGLPGAHLAPARVAPAVARRRAEVGIAQLGRRPAVFLDRDGVLNASHQVDGVPRPPAGPEHVVVLPGAAEACARLREAEFLLDRRDQPAGCRARRPEPGGRRRDQRVLRAQVPVDDIVVCYHDDADGCSCRKPQPGLLLEAAKRWDIDLARSYMVGDRWRDIAAGSGAGCRTILVHGPQEGIESTPDHVAESLVDAADWILTRARGEHPS